MATELKQVLKKLDVIQSELDYIKDNMVPIDAILSEEDKLHLLKARKEFESGKTISLENLKKELGI